MRAGSKLTRQGMNDQGKASQYRLTAAKPAQEPDGRKHRSQKSQTLIVNAMLELVAQGHLEPSADQIAEIAKVGRRSVFRHFKDMDSLYREMNASITASVASALDQPFQATEWRGKVLELVDRRAAVFERLKPFMLSVQIHRHRSPFLKSASLQYVRQARELLVKHLPKEVVRDTTLVEALDMLLSFGTWWRLRDVQGLGVAKAKLVLKRAIEALLQSPPRGPAD
jgi:AcrR family transcriptional regulator